MLWFTQRRASKRERAAVQEAASLRQELLDAKAELEAKDRTIRVQQAELDAMAGVVARDRERVHAETAEHARRVAEAEGTAK